MYALFVTEETNPTRPVTAAGELARGLEAAARNGAKTYGKSHGKAV